MGGNRINGVRDDHGALPRQGPYVYDEAVEFRWFHRTQQCQIVKGGVFTRHHVLGRADVEQTVLFDSIEPRRIRYRTRPSSLYLIVASVFLIAAVGEVITREDEWVADLTIQMSIVVGLGTAWFFQRVRWVSLAPLALLDVAGADDFLDRVSEAKRRQDIRRYARRSPSGAVGVVADLLAEGTISPDEHDALLAEIEEIRRFAVENTGEDRGTGGYL